MAKRLFDISASLVGLLILAPVMAVAALAICLDSPGPALYRAVRVGQGGREFRLLKFRTMVSGADRKGPGITTAADPRVTRVGRVLRRAKLDELPQLVNVLLGDMSLVGPRPEDPRYVTLYSPEQRRVLAVRPGVTSPASIRYRNEAALLDGPDWEARYVSEIMPSKLAAELEYIEARSFWKDLAILLRTLGAVWS